MAVHDLPELSRRRFLSRFGRTIAGGTFLGGTAIGSLVIAGCSNQAAELSPQVVGLFSSSRVIAAGREQRLPFGLVDPGDVVVDSTTVSVVVRHDGEVIDAQTVSGRIVGHDHAPGTEDHEHADLLRYYALRTTLPEPGIYDLVITVGDHELGLPVQAFDPAEIELPLSGDPFPQVETATFANGLGVDPLCTLFEGPCPFHTRSATEVLAGGRPMALLVATPAFCATSYCGPVLGTMIEASDDFPTIDFVHVEPWANPTEGEGLTDPDLRTSPTVDALNLTFEPALFLVGSDGVIVDRIDNVFDATELQDALQALV